MKKLLLLVPVLFVSSISAFWSQESELDYFADTENYQWRDSIDFLQAEEIVQGYEDGTYRPEQTINRAEFTKIVIESYFSPKDFEDFEGDCFTDVASTDWFSAYVCFAKEEEILKGYPDGSFGPGNPINQAEALKIIMNTDTDGDIPEVDGDWYQKFLDEAEYIGMLYFSPENPAAVPVTRGEMAYFIGWLLDEDGMDQIDFDSFDDGYVVNALDVGFEPMTEADCYEDEEYDAADQQCYLVEDYEDEEDYELDEGVYGHQEEEEELPEGNLYSVTDGNIERINGESGVLDQVVWDYFVELFPSNYHHKVKQFLVYKGDGSDDTMAFVTSVKEGDLSEWILAVNINDPEMFEGGRILNLKELRQTLIHEFTHVMTFNDAQFEFEIDEDSCGVQFYTDEGCANKNSFLNLFVKKFWSRKDLDTAMNEGYVYKEDKFVSDYASTNPGEDIAESFVYFIYRKKLETPVSIKDQKTQFFHKFPSLVRMRNQLRKVISEEDQSSVEENETDVSKNDTVKSMNVEKRMLLVLSAPSVENEYYKDAFDEIVAFQVRYIDEIVKAGKDDVRLLVDTKTRSSYEGEVPEEVLLTEDVYDIWMRDFTTVNPSSPVQFTYTNASMTWQESEEVQGSFNDFADTYELEFRETDLLIDGGNIVDNYEGKVITTTRFLEDNDLSYDEGVSELKKLLGATHVAIVEPDEEALAHADGMVSWVGSETLLVNDYSVDPEFQKIVMDELKKAFPDTTIIEVPVKNQENEPGEWEGFSSACGVNLNATVTHNAIYVPTFGMEHEIEALGLIRNNTDKQVITVDARGVCPMGGSVRCLTWQVVGENREKLMQ